MPQERFLPGRPRWTLGVLLGVAVAVAITVMLMAPLWLAPSLSDPDLRAVRNPEKRIALRQAQEKLQDDVRSTILQAYAGVLLLVGAVATARQVQISRDGQITDRFSRAIDQLGAETVDVRVGGVYTLERIARNSAADRAPIGEILAAFIRSHAPWPAGDINHPDPHPTPDVDAAMPWLRDRAPDVPRSSSSAEISRPPMPPIR